MTTAPPDLSSLRIRRDQPAPPSGGKGRRRALALVGLIAGILTVLLVWQVVRPRTVAVHTATANATGGSVATGEGISANGYVVARTKASVSAKMMGRMEYLGVREGSYVKRGEVLARIESADYAAALSGARADVAQAEAQLVQARRELERARTLRNEQLIPESQLEDAATRVSVIEAQLASSRARSRLASVNLENTRVRAPFDGTVLRKDAEVGEIVAPVFGGRRSHAHRDRHDGRPHHARSRSRRQRGVHRADPERPAEPHHARRLSGHVVRGSRAPGGADRGPPEGDGAGEGRDPDRDPRILPEMGAKVVFLRESGAAAVGRGSAARDGSASRGGEGRQRNAWCGWSKMAKPSAKPVVTGTRARRADRGPERADGGETVIVEPPRGRCRQEWCASPSHANEVIMASIAVRDVTKVYQRDTQRSPGARAASRSTSPRATSWR